MMINFHYLATAQRNRLLHVFVPSGEMEKVDLVQKAKSPFSHVILVTRPSKWWETPFFASPVGRMFGYDSEKKNYFVLDKLCLTQGKTQVRKLYNGLICFYLSKMLSYNEEHAYVHINCLNKGSSEVLIGQWSSWLKFGIVPNWETLNEAQSSKCLRCAFFGLDDSNTNFAPWIHLLSNGSSKSCCCVVQIFSWGLDLENELI